MATVGDEHLSQLADLLPEDDFMLLCSPCCQSLPALRGKPGSYHGTFTSSCLATAGTEARQGPQPQQGPGPQPAPGWRTSAAGEPCLVTPALRGCLLPAGPDNRGRRQIVPHVNFPFKMQTRFDRVNRIKIWIG